MSTHVTQSQPSDDLPSGALGPFCLDHFLAGHPDFVFQLKCVPPPICAVLRGHRTALASPAASSPCTQVCVSVRYSSSLLS